MKYEIRYMVDNNEHTEIVDVETAAEAAESVKQHHVNEGDSFELIQVHLLEEEEPAETGQNGESAS